MQKLSYPAQFFENACENEQILSDGFDGPDDGFGNRPGDDSSESSSSVTGDGPFHK